MSAGDNKAVFLSYASQDAEAAKRIADALRGSGVEVWFDQSELVGGDAWDGKIRGQIGSCALFVPVISANTQARLEGYFRLEWKLAEDRSHLMAKGRPFIVPVTVDATSDRGAQVPDAFLKVQWTRLPGGGTPPAFVGRVQSLLGGSGMEAGRPRPAQRDEGAASPVSTKRRSPFALTAGTFAIVVAISTALYVSKKSGSPAASAQPVMVAPQPAAPQVDAKSIAILPFENMSEDKDANAFFADGMHEDILTNLGVVRELHVTSRTSVMQYRGTTKSIRQIGTELGVAYVLEGSVRRAGHKVRVTGQLINARTDEHVWAKAYDRDLTDIFAIQAELSQEIAAALSAAISPQEKSLLENQPTTNLAAYDLFLKARSYFHYYSTGLSRVQAEQMLLEAVKLDPVFAEAWAWLCRAHVEAAFNEEDHSPERLAKASAALETAVRLAPGNPAVIEVQGDFYYYGYRDYARAAEHYQRLLLLRPNSAEAVGKLGLLYRRQGRWAESLADLGKSARLDPRFTGMIENIPETMLALRRYDEAAVEYRRLAALAGEEFLTVLPGDSSFAQVAFVPEAAFFARGSTGEMDEWLANQKPAGATNETKLLVARRAWARLRGDWAQAVQLDRQRPYLDPFDDPHWSQDVAAVFDLVGHNELAAARAQAEKIIPELNALLGRQPANVNLWRALAFLYAFDGAKESALRCGHKMGELIPEATDALDGPLYSLAFAQILAWTGDKDGALAELARLLRTPFGANVYMARVNPGWLPLHGDPRFEALLNDPKNNEPLF